MRAISIGSQGVTPVTVCNIAQALAITATCAMIVTPVATYVPFGAVKSIRINAS
jgi:hypothetical protein